MPTSARSSSMTELRAKSFRELAGIPPSTASPSNSTLIIIDAQNEYADGALKVANLSQTRDAISSLLQIYRDAAAAAGASSSSSPSSSPSNIIHIVHSVPEGAPFFTPQTALAEIFSEISPLDTEKVITKHLPSAFRDTELHDYLQSLPDGRGKKIVLAGYMAHVCVSTTARQGSELGYDVLVVGDAVGDRDIPGARGEEVTRMVLAELADSFGTVVETKDVK